MQGKQPLQAVDDELALSPGCSAGIGSQPGCSAAAERQLLQILDENMDQLASKMGKIEKSLTSVWKVVTACQEENELAKEIEFKMNKEVQRSVEAKILELRDQTNDVIEQNGVHVKKIRSDIEEKIKQAQKINDEAQKSWKELAGVDEWLSKRCEEQ